MPVQPCTEASASKDALREGVLFLQHRAVEHVLERRLQ